MYICILTLLLTAHNYYQTMDYEMTKPFLCFSLVDTELLSLCTYLSQTRIAIIAYLILSIIY